MTEYPGQELLEGAIDPAQKISEHKSVEAIEVIREAARTIDMILKEDLLNVILGPTDSRMPTIAAAAGYPVGTMPLGYSKTNGRPFGMCVIAGANREDNILRVMSAWEATKEKRRVPPQMVRKEGGRSLTFKRLLLKIY
jgi:amidase